MSPAWCNPSLSLPERVRAWVEYNEPEARWDEVYQNLLEMFSEGPMPTEPGNYYVKVWNACAIPFPRHGMPREAS